MIGDLLQMLQYFGPDFLSWWSEKQMVVARSSISVECRSLAHMTASCLESDIIMRTSSFSHHSCCVLR